MFTHALIPHRHLLVLATLVASGLLAPAAGGQNVVAHYPLDEGSGSVAMDVSGNANHGTLFGASYTGGIPVACAPTTGLTFSRTARVEVPDSASLRPSSGATVEAWVQLSSLAAIRVIVGKQLGIGADSYVLYVDSSGLANFAWHDGVVQKGVAGTKVDDGQWHHLAGVLRGSDGEIYVDGTLISSGLFGGTIGYDGNPVSLGNDLNGVTWLEGLRGDLDEVRIHDAGMTPQQVRASFLAYSPAVGTPRNGTGVNAMGFAQVTRPVIGTSWQTTVDIATSGALLSVVAVSAAGPTTIASGFGEVLCLPPFAPIDVATGSHALPIPNDCSLLGSAVCTQAATFEPGDIRFQNALDLIIGAF